MKLEGDPLESAETRRAIHTWVIGGSVYSNQLKPGVAEGIDSPLVRQTATDYAADLLSRMEPRDPLEEMLAMQCLWTHGRVAHLSQLANHQTEPNNVRVVNEYCDRAANTFRRLVLALAEYRRPADPPMPSWPSGRRISPISRW